MSYPNLEVVVEKGGGITVQCARFVHKYEDPQQAAEAALGLLAGADASGWQGNNPEHRIVYTSAEVRNDKYRVYETEDLRESIGTAGPILCGWRNETGFLAALTGRPVVDWTEEGL